MTSVFFFGCCFFFFQAEDGIRDDLVTGVQTCALPISFVVVEGMDGSGSTTVSERLASHLAGKRRPVHRTCEPSGGPIGALIRQILAHRVVVPTEWGHASPGWATMALLFASYRADHLQAAVLPRLRDGVIVISDRYDLSSLAYQSATAPAEDPAEA